MEDVYAKRQMKLMLAGQFESDQPAAFAGAARDLRFIDAIKEGLQQSMVTARTPHFNGAGYCGIWRCI